MSNGSSAAAAPAKSKAKISGTNGKGVSAAKPQYITNQYGGIRTLLANAVKKRRWSNRTTTPIWAMRIALWQWSGIPSWF